MHISKTFYIFASSNNKQQVKPQKIKEMTNKEFEEKINNGEANVLTVEAAKQLKGMRIAYYYYAYNPNKECVGEMVVGDMVSEWDYNEEKYPYLVKNFSEEEKAESKSRLLLLSEDDSPLNPDDEDFCIYSEEQFFDEPTFCCTDSDCEVYYLPL